MKIWFNKKLVDSRKAAVSVLDRGFLYGDGVYETLRVYSREELFPGKKHKIAAGFMFHVFREREHLERLSDSARGVSIRLTWKKDTIARGIWKVIRANRRMMAHGAVIRVTVTRGQAKSLGFDPKLTSEPTLVILPQTPRLLLARQIHFGVHVALVSVRRTPRVSLDPANKSINNLNNILAKMEADRLGAYEAVMCNVDGYLAEGTISNLFLIKRGVVCTPSLSCGILSGITRGAVIDLCRGVGLKVKEGSFRPRDLAQADEIFLTSTGMEVLPVSSFIFQDGKRHQVGKGRGGYFSLMLRRLFRELVIREAILENPKF